MASDVYIDVADLFPSGAWVAFLHNGAEVYPRWFALSVRAFTTPAILWDLSINQIGLAETEGGSVLYKVDIPECGKGNTISFGVPSTENTANILICGGRDYASKDAIDYYMRRLVAMFGNNLVIHHGACPTGADALVDEWCQNNGVQVVRYPADWTSHGRAAGPIRNSDMLKAARPMMCVAFKGGRGTADMISKCRSNGVYVVEV